MKEIFINNYHTIWLKAWNSNMDLQLALDPYAIIGYCVAYYSKDETGMTKLLKDCLNAHPDLDFPAAMKELGKCYINSRQIGQSECIYRVFPNMLLKDSNITTVYVPSGFEKNRSVRFTKISDEFDEMFHAAPILDKLSSIWCISLSFVTSIIHPSL